MRNKLIIISFALLFSGAALAQGGSDLSQERKISIYPNPAVEHIIVQLDNEFSNAEFELNSMIGNKLQIKPEERALQSIFGEAFTAYRGQTRRWL